MENMPRKNSISKIKQAVAPLLKAEPKVGFGYLFGSRSRGETKVKSDYDLAVYFDEPEVIKRHDLLFKLAADISRELNTDLIDIHSLNDLQSPELKFHIIHDGILLFERGPYRVLVEPRILNEYFDFMYLLRKYHLTNV